MNANTKKIIRNILWLGLAVGIVILLGAAVKNKNNQHIQTIKINIEDAEEHLFVDEKDIVAIINQNGNVLEKVIHQIPLQQLEQKLESTPWIKNAEIFINNKKELEVNLKERQPIARIFTMQGYSFYIDSVGKILPLSEKLSARVPMFTGFGGNIFKLSSPDSIVLQQIITIGKTVYADSFYMAQTAQIYITPQATFEIIPTIGNHIVALGNANNIENKLHNLFLFYKKAWLQNGINTYEKIDVQYKNQVVAIKRGTSQQIADSAAAKKALADMLAQSPNYTLIDSIQTKPLSTIKKDSTVIKKQNIIQLKKLPEKKLPINGVSNNKLIKKTLIIKDKSAQKTVKQAKPVPKAVLHNGKNNKKNTVRNNN